MVKIRELGGSATFPDTPISDGCFSLNVYTYIRYVWMEYCGTIPKMNQPALGGKIYFILCLAITLPPRF